MEQRFYKLLDNHILNLNQKFRNKFSVRQSLYDDIVLALRDGWGDSQFKYWVRKNFKLITNGNEHDVYEIESNLPIVIYENLYEKIKECHEKDGHRGRDKTWIALKKRYAWIPMDSVKIFVSQCDICSKRNAKAFLGPLAEKLTDSYEYLNRLQVNVLDMQNMSDGEYKWILYMRDRFTKCAWAYPLKSNEMGPITEKLLQQYYFFAISQTLQSVHRREFAAQVIESFEKKWTNLKIINGRISHSRTHDFTEDDSNEPFKLVLYKWMLSNNRKDWSNCLLLAIHSRENGAANLTNNKTPTEIVFHQNTNYNVEICQILSNHVCLDEENCPYNFIDELKKSTQLLNFVQNISSSDDSLSSSPSYLALQEISKSSLSIPPSRLKYHASSNISTSTKKRRRLTSNSNEEINVFDKDKQSNDNNNNNTNLINNHQQVQPKTNEIVYVTNMTKGQKLFTNTSYKHEYKVGDLVGVIIDKIETVNIELKVLACKILSIELVAEDTNAYQLCTKACIISSRFQASDLLNLCNCNFVDLLTVDPTHLPQLTFNEACKSLS
ncbi:unnamed protein product [Rotaria magnacalcarata]|uniref:Integrase zinc-binding domain-containing protein n=3 Tax=Rotaria magnacalcarata TaxID=392030 RepID=A0A816CEL2_9BILA|nr:unnamed protein product [Rotaria magnacalcarata]CAF2174789.1 unnamed protein product [Rotaria magnacalcarata]CAF3892017.1 unnamed protein product [Rotaria magnacalcarata]